MHFRNSCCHTTVILLQTPGKNCSRHFKLLQQIFHRYIVSGHSDRVMIKPTRVEGITLLSPIPAIRTLRRITHDFTVRCPRPSAPSTRNSRDRIHHDPLFLDCRSTDPLLRNTVTFHGQ